MGTFLRSIELDELLILVNNESNEVMLHIRLLFRLFALSLGSKLFVLIFEVISCLKRGRTLFGSLRLSLLQIVIQDTSSSDLNLLKVVESSV